MVSVEGIKSALLGLLRPDALFDLVAQHSFRHRRPAFRYSHRQVTVFLTVYWMKFPTLTLRGTALRPDST